MLRGSKKERGGIWSQSHHTDLVTSDGAIYLYGVSVTMLLQSHRTDLVTSDGTQPTPLLGQRLESRNPTVLVWPLSTFDQVIGGMWNGPVLSQSHRADLVTSDCIVHDQELDVFFMSQSRGTDLVTSDDGGTSTILYVKEGSQSHRADLVTADDHRDHGPRLDPEHVAIPPY